MMFCAQCGKNVPDSASFCPYCSAALRKPGTQADAQTNPQAGAQTPGQTAPYQATNQAANQTASYQPTPSTAQRQGKGTVQATLASLIPRKVNRLPLIIGVAVVAVILIGFFVIRPLIFGGGGENGNRFAGGQVIRVGSNSFFTFADSSRDEYAIYCVGNGANDEAEAIYESKSSLYLFGADGSTLYFGEDDKYYSIPARQGTQKPERIRVTVDESNKATVAVLEEYDWDPDEFNSTGYAYGSSSTGFDGGILYSASTAFDDDGDNPALIVQKIDLKKGSLTLSKNTAVTLYEDEYLSSFAYYKGDIYYAKYDSSDYKLLGIFSVKADSATAKEKLVFDDMSSRYNYGRFVLADNRLFFIESPSSSSSNDPTSLNQVPLSGGTVTTVTDDFSGYIYNVQGGRVYYFDGDELVSCKYDGSDVKTLAKGGDDKTSLYLSDNWVYYKYSGENDWYRVRSNEGTYPKKSLT